MSSNKELRSLTSGSAHEKFDVRSRPNVNSANIKIFDRRIETKIKGIFEKKQGISGFLSRNSQIRLIHFEKRWTQGKYLKILIVCLTLLMKSQINFTAFDC